MIRHWKYDGKGEIDKTTLGKPTEIFEADIELHEYDGGSHWQLKGYESMHHEDLVDAPLEWQLRGRQQTASGYGRALTTTNKGSFAGKLYRAYCTIYPN